MPQYLIDFKLETCLSRDQDLEFEFRGHQSKLLFSKKTPTDKYLIARIEVSATDNRVAWRVAASTLVPPILDALSFATGTPLLLRDCELVLKDQAGLDRRRALYIGHRHVPSIRELRTAEIDEANKILEGAEDLRLPLCWHRYALDRSLVIEQFIFNWLAFEALAGDSDVATRCPKCQTELAHCDVPITHRGSSKTAAREIFQKAYPATTDKEFNNQIWNKARNYVFHGRKYPEPKYLLELLEHSQELHAAVDKRVDKMLGLGNRPRPHSGYETLDRRFIFVEWRTQSPSSQFASDFPLHHLMAMTEEDDVNGPAHQAAYAGGVALLAYAESNNW